MSLVKAILIVSVDTAVRSWTPHFHSGPLKPVHHINWIMIFYYC